MSVRLVQLFTHMSIIHLISQFSPFLIRIKKNRQVVLNGTKGRRKRKRRRRRKKKRDVKKGWRERRVARKANFDYKREQICYFKRIFNMCQRLDKWR